MLSLSQPRALRNRLGGMDRTLTLDSLAAIPVGHRVEVSEYAGGAGAAPFAITDLDSGIRYLPSEDVGDARVETVWRGTVRACAVVATAQTHRTRLVVTTRDRSAAEDALAALGAADAAFAAANAEALRWGSKPGNPEPPRP